jgi:hypothetical protein
VSAGVLKLSNYPQRVLRKNKWNWAYSPSLCLHRMHRDKFAFNPIMFQPNPGTVTEHTGLAKYFLKIKIF